MPPWKADNAYRHFANDRSLTEDQIKTIVAWIDNKAPRGDAGADEVKPLLDGTA